MGTAVARLLGRTHRLLLSDVSVERLDTLLAAFSDEGYQAEGMPGDLADPDFARSLARRCDELGSLRSLVNAAGLSPAQADWLAIVRANTIAPTHLLDAFEPLLERGAACVMIASVAGHLGPPDPEADALLAGPLEPDMPDGLEPRLRALAEADGGTVQGHAYSLSKRAVIRMCERRAPDWGRKGARIVSVSPGMVWTPMGRREAESGTRAASLLARTPAGRWGTAMDVATTVEYLVSDAAGYITGCDILVDGGAVAAVRGQRF